MSFFSKNQKTLLSAFIQEEWVYLDPNSIEPFIGTIKRKYKLFGKQFLNQFHFFVLTTCKTACKEYLSIEIVQSDWEKKKSGYLRSEFSYTDLTKRCIITSDELLKKCTAKSDPFLDVAKIKSNKYKELLLKVSNFHMLQNQDAQKELTKFFKLDHKGVELLAKLGINSS